MNKSMNIHLTLKDYGISESNFKENLDRISHNSMGDTCTGANPAKITEKEMKKLFQYIIEKSPMPYPVIQHSMASPSTIATSCMRSMSMHFHYTVRKGNGIHWG